MIAQSMEITTKEESREIVGSRIIKAPRDLVYELFTKPEFIDKWYGPKGCESKTHKMELKVGGLWQGTMNMPNGKSFEMWMWYTEIIKNERIAFDSGHNEDTQKDQMFLTTIDFKDAGENTQITITMSYTNDKMFEQAKSYGGIQGYSQALEKLEEYVATL